VGGLDWVNLVVPLSERAGNTASRRRHEPWRAGAEEHPFLAQTAIDSGPSTSQVKLRFSDIARISHVAKTDLGTKRICPTTGKKFYDLNKNPVISPYTGEVVPIAPIAPARAPRGEAARAAAATEAPEVAETEELVSLEEADAEENTGKVKAVVPESEDDIEVDETLEDDDDDDSTFIADEEEGDEDVTDIIGDVGGDEET
jgi:uncharacterized protein (TIGR02300 family)